MFAVYFVELSDFFCNTETLSITCIMKSSLSKQGSPENTITVQFSHNSLDICTICSSCDDSNQSYLQHISHIFSFPTLIKVYSVPVQHSIVQKQL